MSIYFSTRNGGVRGAKALSEADEAWTSAVVAAACGYGDSRPHNRHAPYSARLLDAIGACGLTR